MASEALRLPLTRSHPKKRKVNNPVFFCRVCSTTRLTPHTTKSLSSLTLSLVLSLTHPYYPTVDRSRVESRSRGAAMYLGDHLALPPGLLGLRRRGATAQALGPLCARRAGHAPPGSVSVTDPAQRGQW